MAVDELGFAMEDRSSGVYVAGVSRRPMDVTSSTRDGTGAALKAIQTSFKVREGPRRSHAFQSAHLRLHRCGIGECLSASRLAEVSESELNVPAKVHGPLCVPEGLDFLRKDIQEQGADQAVIVACSHRVNWDVFSTDSLGVDTVERVNVREGVAWSKPPNDEETQALADDYVRMGIARSHNTVPVPPKVEPTLRDLLVVGGGVSGLTAALEASGRWLQGGPR